MRSAPEGAEVGKGKPPRHSRFSKGESGNPKGRPKGAKNVSTIIQEAANSAVTATIDGKQRRISKLAASAMQLATKAASGDTRLLNTFLDRMEEIEAKANASSPIQFPFEASDLEVLKAIHERMKLCGAPEAFE